jgi:hypothetical protein
MGRPRRRLLIALALLCFFPFIASSKEKKTTTVDEGTLISVRVMDKISVKHLKPGDQLEFRCFANVFDTNHDHIVLPKGAAIHGVVAESIARDESHPESKLSIRFDHADWDNGTTPLNAKFFGNFASGASSRMNVVVPMKGMGTDKTQGRHSPGVVTLGPGDWTGPDLVISPDSDMPTLVSKESDVELDAGVLFMIRNYPQ